MSRPARRIGALILPVVLLLSAAPSALAASASVTGDDGNQIALGGAVSIRHMSPEVRFAFAPDERRYSAQVLGPDGAPASSGTTCSSTASPSAERVRYRGNGAYTVVIRVTTNEEDATCAEATEQRAAFTIDARTGIGAPDSNRLLTRRPGSLSTISYEVPVQLNPGADSHELRFARNATLGPDGGISGTSQQAFVNSSTGLADVSFNRPGRYTLVVRAKVTTADGERATAWSSPVVVDAVAPFDFSSITLPDSSGPSYKLAAVVREKSARGRVQVSIARGRKGKRFKRLGSPRIRRGGKISLRFRAARVGIYTVRFHFKGSKTTAGGTVKEVFRVYRF
ncbi:MAG TPA: hypothetical protein VM266_14550 [Solirubrobacteraceae bacterium]|nr:hypothetical protein [Solirubrobacteraceae bacterium]